MTALETVFSLTKKKRLKNPWSQKICHLEVKWLVMTIYQTSTFGSIDRVYPEKILTKAVEASQSWWVRPSCCYWSCSCWRSLLQYSCTLLAAIFERIFHRGKVHGKDDDTLKLSRYPHYAQSSSLQLTQSVGLECASKETQSPSFALLPLLPTCNFSLLFWSNMVSIVEHSNIE